MSTDDIRQFLTAIRDGGRTTLSESEALNVLQLAGVPVVRMKSIPGADDVALAAYRVGFPVALKINSPDIPHKSDVGGVVLSLNSAEEVSRAAKEMHDRVRTAHPEARFHGFTVQAMAQGVETLVSATTDPAFGPVLAFGLGGVWVEVLEDVAFRLVPVGPEDVDEMMAEVKGRKLLEGYRGFPAVHKDALKEALLSLSNLLGNLSDEIAEVEINPLLAGPEGVAAVDGLVRLHENDSEGRRP